MIKFFHIVFKTHAFRNITVPLKQLILQISKVILVARMIFFWFSTTFARLILSKFCQLQATRTIDLGENLIIRACLDSSYFN